jgi:NADPH-dependent curcumin reductase CurA
MALQLVVTSPFAGFQIGDQISDAKLVAEYAASHPDFVVKVQAPDPQPAKTAP